MPIHIDEVVSTVRTMDDSALLSPKVLNQIVRAVMEQVRAEADYNARIRREQGLGSELSRLNMER